MSNEPVIGTSDMPEPHIFDYSSCYMMTPVFLNDLRIVLGDTAYADVKKIIRKIDDHRGMFTGAELNEFINTLTNLPFKTIAPLMAVIENKDKFGKYFESVKTTAQSE